MTINFVCQSCKKKVKAPETAGGKWGNCPHCNLKCYIPLPPAPPEEELTLLPIEEEPAEIGEERMRENINTQLSILHETGATSSKAPNVSRFNEADKKKLWKNIILYLRQMADAELDQAQQSLGNIVVYQDRAKEIIAKIARSEKPEPELANIAPVVLKALIKNLISEINASKDK